MSDIENILTTDLIQSIRAEMAWNYSIIPVRDDSDLKAFWIDERKFSISVENELEAIIGTKVQLIPKNSEEIKLLLSKYFRGQQDETSALEYSGDFVERIFNEALNLKSSDIHIEIFEDQARVRMRVDGQLIERFKLELTIYPELINKIKIRSNLDISEKRLPQDGRMEINEMDVRVSVLPTLYGEKVVLRILGKDATTIELKQLGLTERDYRNYLEGIKKPTGMVLISGPTGSGKTTTLYGTLKLLNDERRNIVTIEDPIEYTLKGINQVQLKENIGLTFSSALRSFLRQDPDIIMLGEIRDADTAQMAVRAALTGHLVLSTIHTNSAWGTVSRLIDMGVPSFLLANTLNTTVAQRLLRKLCKDCSTKVELDKVDWPLGVDEKFAPKYTYLPIGCPSCHYTGYSGRTAVYEVIPIDVQLAQKIKNGELNVSNELNERGITSLAFQALELIRKGETSLEEAYSLLTEL